MPFHAFRKIRIAGARRLLPLCGYLCFLIVCQLILAELLLGALAWRTRARQAARNKAALASASAFKIMCLGESITFDAYPAELEAWFASRREATGRTVSVLDLGVPNATTGDIAADIDRNLERFRPDAVVVMAGNNDGVGPGAPKSGLADFLCRSRLFRLFYMMREGDAVPVAVVGAQSPELDLEKSWRTRTELAAELGIEKDADWRYVAEPAGRAAADDDDGADFESELERMRGQGRHRQAFDFLCRRAAAAGSKHAIDIYARAGDLLSALGDEKGGERLHKELVLRFYSEPDAYIRLYQFYQSRGNTRDAAFWAMRLLEDFPVLPWMYFSEAALSLSRLMLRGGRDDIAAVLEGVFRSRRWFGAEEMVLYGAIGVCALNSGNAQMARYWFDRANELRMRGDFSYTARKLRRICSACLERGTGVAVMQYPLRRIEFFRKMLPGFGDSVLFVENFDNFFEAVSGGGYERVFRDQFGGEFGHLTVEGSRLVAERLGEALLERFFGGVKEGGDENAV